MEDESFGHTFSAADFWPAFQKDLTKAQARVIIQSPFITSRRVMMLQSYLSSLLIRNVRLCLFLQAPSRRQDHPPGQRLSPRDRAQEEDAANMIHWLQQQGAHLNLRPRIHEKIAIIDKSILWEGSLNILSHKDTEERMRRIKSQREVRKAIVDHRLNMCEQCLESEKLEVANVTSQLVKVRQMFKLTQRDLADACGLTQSVVSRFEKRDANVSMESVEKLARGLEHRVVVLPEWVLPTVFTILTKVESNLKPESIGDVNMGSF